MEVIIARADAGEYKEETVTVTLGNAEEAGITDASDDSDDSEETTEEEEEQGDVYEIDPNNQDLEDLFRFFGY